MLLKPLYEADEVEVQVVAGCCDGAFLDCFQTDGAGFRLDMAAFALAGSTLDAEVVWRC
jgi:hypothetical protein